MPRKASPKKAVKKASPSTKKVGKSPSPSPSPPPPVVSKRRVSKKAGKDPNAPKRNASAFMIWLNANRSKFQKEGVPITEVSKMAGAEWRSMTAKDKAPWDKKAVDEKAKYLKAKAAYEKTQK